MKNIVLLEGPDRSGKSTYALKLNESLAFKTVGTRYAELLPNSRPSVRSFLSRMSHYEAFRLAITNEHQNIVIDRGFLSSYVYDTIRGIRDFEILSEMKLLNRTAEQYDVKVDFGIFKFAIDTPETQRDRGSLLESFEQTNFERINDAYADAVARYKYCAENYKFTNIEFTLSEITDEQ